MAFTTQTDRDGNVAVSHFFNFIPGWSQIVAVNTPADSILLFYNADSGLAVTGLINNERFVQFPTVLRFSPGWTNIVATDQGSLLFYNAQTGSGAVGYLATTHDPNCDWEFVCEPVDAQFVQKQPYKPDERALVDITGGKKIMSAIAGQVAWDLDLPLCYLESPAYNPALRRPDPGSEVLLVFPKPSEQRINGHREEPFELSCYHNQRYLV